ncbi:MAG TPA: serine hydrolase [Streptosporangiaceae bacterium]|jgi:beta-lactamase class A
MNADGLDAEVRAAARRGPGRLAVAVRPIGGGTAYGFHEHDELSLASVSKLLVLAEAARRVDAGELDPAEPVIVVADDLVNGTGLLRRLTARTWPVADLAWLTSSVSDNTATNALLRRLGRDAVNAYASALGLTATRLLDRIRDTRTPTDPPALAIGTAADLAHLTSLIGTRALLPAAPSPAGDLTPGAARQVVEWLRANTDHHLVPALLLHDPYAPGLPEDAPAGTVWIAAKTGIDTGVRAEAGIMVAARAVGYAVLTTGEPGVEPGLVAAIRETGLAIARHAAGWHG